MLEVRMRGVGRTQLLPREQEQFKDFVNVAKWVGDVAAAIKSVRPR